MSDLGKTVKDAVDNTRDSVNETLHRSAAEGEKTRRQVEGDTMTTKDKAASVTSEATHRISAEIDAAKRDVRTKT